MGSKHSKGKSVHDELQCIVPASWNQLQQYHTRFQQEAHRRRDQGPDVQYVITFPVFCHILAPIINPHKEKLRLLRIFQTLDRQHRLRIAMMDFFCGLALITDIKKSIKFECEK